MKMVYPAVFYPGGNGDFAVEFPDLPGCVSGGENMDKAIEMGQDAACGWIVGEWERGNRVNPPSEFDNIHPDNKEPDAFVSLVMLDMNVFALRYDKKVIRKNL